jgi:YbgC/YbaW family acyl-CoA thioester hydrolase
VERADLDAMHHVNNAVYVAWAEQAAHRHLSDMGWGVLQWREQGLRLVTYRMDLEYVQAAHLDDIIVVATRPWIRHYTLIWQIVMHRGTDELVRGSLWQCAIDGQRWVRALPFDLRARLAPSATDSGTHRL